MHEVQTLKCLAEEYDVLPLANVILHDNRFLICSGSSKRLHHHYGDGGLLRHTTEVVELCLKNNEYFKPLKKAVCERKLFLAALFHDAGKMWDYSCVDGQWQSNIHKRHIHHISRSGIVWSQAAKEQGFEDNDEILHAILAHHGLKEWGSPVSPNTRMAWLLHLCDGISARMDDGDQLDCVNEKP
jgi:3'-5' exoribonuclease